MKKIIVVCFSIVLITFVSGCGSKKNNKKLTCIQDSSDILKIKLDMSFKNNKLDTMKVNYIYDLSSKNDTDDDIKRLVKDDESCKDLGLFEDSYKSALLTCKAEVNNKKLSIDTTYDVNKIEDSVIKSDKSYSKVKEYFEMQSLTCK